MQCRTGNIRHDDTPCYYFEIRSSIQFLKAAPKVPAACPVSPSTVVYSFHWASDFLGDFHFWIKICWIIHNLPNRDFWFDWQLVYKHFLFHNSAFTTLLLLSLAKGFIPGTPLAPRWPPPLTLQFHTAVLSVLWVMFPVQLSAVVNLCNVFPVYLPDCYLSFRYCSSGSNYNWYNRTYLVQHSLYLCT
jgi:hypothetical protein